METVSQWILRRRVSPDILQECLATGVDSLVAHVLCARRIDTPAKIAAFLRADEPLADPHQMAGVPAAVERIGQAIEAGERIAVYGDFDVDGIAGTALLVSLLRALGAHVEPYIPDRFEEGYGLNIPALSHLKEQGVSLCIAVDCGVRSYKEVAYAQEHGLDMVILDHHTVPERLPPAVAVVDPKRSDSLYPFRDLAGVGVAYQVGRALCQRIGAPLARDCLESSLDLVALGTVADIVPLVEENRSLARWGLERMRVAPCPGLKALMQVAGVDPTRVSSEDIAFRLAPRLNAAGRIEHAQAAYRLLMAHDEEEARPWATLLQRMNAERQELLERQIALAEQEIAEQALPHLLFIEGPEYHEGIVGLIASRLREKYYRPTLVLRRGSNMARGSARSIERFHITHALDACQDLLERYGGHAQAAGFTLPSERVPTLRQRLLEYAQKHLDEEALTPRLFVDAIIPLDEVRFESVQALETLEPFGKGNPEPLFASLRVRLLSMRRVGTTGGHLRLEVSQGGKAFPAIAFRQGDLAEALHVGDFVDIVYRPTLNAWRDSVSVQLVIAAMRPAKG